MQHSTTKGSSRTQLTTPQTKVLTALLSGSTVTDAAKQADVDRTTCHRWLRDDWKFQAALNRGRRDLTRVVEARLLHLAHQAADTVAQAVEEGDVRAALVVLKGLGFLPERAARFGCDDPEILREEAEITANKEALERQLRAMSPM